MVVVVVVVEVVVVAVVVVVVKVEVDYDLSCRLSSWTRAPTSAQSISNCIFVCLRG